MDTRLYTLALGQYNNFKARTDGLAGNGDTTPSVRNISLLYFNNTGSAGANAITDFDNAEEGKLLVCYILDTGATVIDDGSFINLEGGKSVQGTEQTLVLLQHNSSWYELARTSAAGQQAIALNVDSAITVNYGVSRAILTGSGGNANVTYHSISGGTVGQTVTLRPASPQSSIIISSAGNIIMNATNAYVLGASDGLVVTKMSASTWRLYR